MNENIQEKQKADKATLLAQKVIDLANATTGLQKADNLLDHCGCVKKIVKLRIDIDKIISTPAKDLAKLKE